MKRLIIGRGISGTAAEALTAFTGHEFHTVTDRETTPAELDWNEFDTVIVSPGVRPESPLLLAAQTAGLPILSELEYGARHFRGILLAVTGTNGKTTTVELTTHILKALYQGTVSEAGNIGLPLSTLAARTEQPALAVVEVSSFQLEYADRFAPKAAVLLNIAGDHLDRYHDSIDAYAQVKYSIFRHVPAADRIVMHGLPGGAAPRFGADADGWILDDGARLFRQSDTHLAGEHNLENLLAALELCSRVLDGAVIRSPELAAAVMSFRTGRHRLEEVANFNGVRCVNDSKATNPASVAAALRTFAGSRVHLLLGGLDKDMDFSLLNDYAGQIVHAYIIGRAAPKIAATLAGHIPGSRFDGYEEAIDAMLRTARPGEVVLLSPACASMDMFRDYQERGDRFRDACQRAEKHFRATKEMGLC